MLRTLFLLSLFVSVSACGQPPLASDPHGKEVSEPQLHEDLRGTWSPYSRNYQRFGDLVLGADFLSWGACMRTEYRVLQVKELAYYLELLAAPPCTLRVGGSFFILAPSDRGLEVSVCATRDELDRPRSERHCSWGILNKKDG